MITVSVSAETVTALSDTHLMFYFTEFSISFELKRCVSVLVEVRE